MQRTACVNERRGTDSRYSPAIPRCLYAATAHQESGPSSIAERTHRSDENTEAREAVVHGSADRLFHSEQENGLESAARGACLRRQSQEEIQKRFTHRVRTTNRSGSR